MIRRYLPTLAVWRRIAWRFAAVALLVFSVTQLSISAFAQEERRVKTKVDPRYPDLARQNNLYGTTRLQVLIARDGSVKDIKALGGSPLLVQASMEAVRRWKYEPGPAESTVVLKFDFKP